MNQKRKDGIQKLLKGIETGDEAAIAVVNPHRYIQHNPQTQEGGEGLAALFKRLAKSSPRVDILRIFSDGDYVFAHTRYDFDISRVGFEIFRFEGEQTVEHWDNIQPRLGPNILGHTMLGGPTEATDLDRTEVNRELVRCYVNDVLIKGQFANQDKYIDFQRYIEHHPHVDPDRPALYTKRSDSETDESVGLVYDRMHRILAEGNFVLTVCEGSLDGVHSSFFDLFRVDNGTIVEHWDTIETVPPRSEWKNDNGKF